ncbi:MAG: outer membrane lipoprotein-sorting protein [Verrucomicrobiaceae bacterium]|nr:outer membrane lipoprotein-sorting protein [Verrucomicrobiaceae bacterium]
MKTLILLSCCLALSSVLAQDMNTQLPLVRKLDAMRLPSEDFTARVTIQKSKTGSSEIDDAQFRQYSRRRSEPGGRVILDTLVICDQPKKDAGKMILFVGDVCWFFDPRARRATRMSSQQVASQALVADLMNWRFADDFDHQKAGQEPVSQEGLSHSCMVLDFTPKPGMKNRPALVRCWIDTAGRIWKAEHYTASRKIFRTVLFTHYETVLGAERATGLRIVHRGEVEEITLKEIKASQSPASYFDPQHLPSIAAP